MVPISPATLIVDTINQLYKNISFYEKVITGKDTSLVYEKLL